MKRLFIIGLCAVLLLTFTGCDDTPEQPAGGTTGATTVTTTVTTTTPTTTTEAPTTTTTTSTPAYPRADGKLTDEEKAALNESISRELQSPLNRMLEEQWLAFPFDTNLLQDPQRAAAFVWELAVSDQSVPKRWEVSPEGEGPTGSAAIKEADYTAFYSRVLGQKADIDALLVFDTPNFVLHKGEIYGHFPTGGREPLVLKVVSFAGNGTSATLTVDMITAFEEAVSRGGRPYADFDENLLNMYWDSATLDYPAEAVFARMTLQLTRTAEGYVADGLYFKQMRSTTTFTSATAPTTTTTAEVSTTTTKTPTTTEAPTTTTTQPPVTDTALQIGGPTFTLDGVTFEMGVSPEKLLAHLGEPEKVAAVGEAVLGGICVLYDYEGLRIETFSPHEPQTHPVELSEAKDQVLRAIYFKDNRYAFDGITIGDTVEKLDERVSHKLEPDRYEVTNGYYDGGPAYSYDAAKEDGIIWIYLFQDMEEEELDALRANGYVVKPETQIRTIIISYNYIEDYNYMLQ